MSSLREAQARFAAALLGEAPVEPRIEVYRRNVFANWRHALAATYPVVERLVGSVFFGALAERYARAHPSTSGDLNAFGASLAVFLRFDGPAKALAYLPDVAALEWAIDGASRAADARASAAEVTRQLSQVAFERLSLARLRLHPAARLVACAHPAMRLWQIHQPGYAGEFSVDLEAGPEWLLVTRPHEAPCIERIGRAEHAWLETLAKGTPLGPAFDVAFGTDSRFDLIATLGRRVADGTIAGVEPG